MGRNRALPISVLPLLLILALPGCSGVREAYREQTSPSAAMPIDCRFTCPVPPNPEQARAEARLDNLVVLDLRESRESVGSMYSANGDFTLICKDGASFERTVEEDIAGRLARHKVAVGGDRGSRPPAGVSLYVEILDGWVESREAGSSAFKVPIEASVAFRAVLQDDRTGIILWETECRGNDTDNVWYSLSRHHATSLGKAYCEAIRSFDAAVASAAFLQALRR